MHEYLYAYTTEEGGYWWGVIGAQERPPVLIVEELFTKWHIAEDVIEAPPERSYLGATRVHSVRFPDGRIWDAFFRGWRDEAPRRVDFLRCSPDVD